MGRIMAVDYGKKRTGLAVTDPLKLVPGGLTTLPSHEVLAFIIDYCARETVERILVGYPMQLNNQPSESMQYVDPFYRALKKRLTIPVDYVDERYTSVLAHKAMLDGGLKKRTDRIKPS